MAKIKRPYKCSCCNRRGTHDQVMTAKFPHTPSCRIGMYERGERCPDCKNTKLTTCSGSEHDYGCPSCGQRWDLETFLDSYYNDEPQF